MTPVEVVKQRLQLHNTPYKGAMDCITQTFRNEGFFAFYRSFSTQLVMSIPFQCTHLTTYEYLRQRYAVYTRTRTLCLCSLTNMVCPFRCCIAWCSESPLCN